MGVIHELSEDIVNKIAAGEVVERPASVVKELLENAVDAGASRIEIELVKGGQESIVVRDNGCGMADEDAKLCLKRHATSKLKSAEDLFDIHTLGFRGEALPSIAAVSKLTLHSVKESAGKGVKVIASSCGQELQVMPWNGSRGTVIRVEELFFNLPVRRQFLKSAATEYAHCLELVQAYIAAYPHIEFLLFHNGKKQLQSEAANSDEKWIGEPTLRKKASEVFPKEQLQHFMYFRKEDTYGRVEGLLSTPGYEKSLSKSLLMFCNGRWVRDKTLRFGVMRGYHSHLLKNKFPQGLLYVNVDPTIVDVNVHPTKSELRFQYGSQVQTLIASAIQSQLRSGAWMSPQPITSSFSTSGGLFAQPTDLSREKGSDDPLMNPLSLEKSTGDFSKGLTPQPSQGRPHSVTSQVKMTKSSFDGDPAPSMGNWGASLEGEEAANLSIRNTSVLPSPSSVNFFDEPTPTGESVPWAEMELMGVMNRCYLFFTHRQRLLVVDQHAFHERILYERFKNDSKLLGMRQPLLVPEAVSLRPSQVAQLRGNQANLEKIGIEFILLDEQTVEIKALPTVLVRRDPSAILEELSAGDEGVLFQQDVAGLAHHTLATLACHSAVRSGEELGENEWKQLLGEAANVDFFHNCPHGRRVFRWWNCDQVAKWFDR